MSHSIISENIAVEDRMDTELEREIVHLKTQIHSLKAQRSLYASSLLSSLSSCSALTPPGVPNTSSAKTENVISLRSKAEAQRTHNQNNLYRMCAGITAFRTQDSDPNAVDEGRLVALRFDVSMTGRFVRPYYVFLNRPWSGKNKSLVKIHKHTLPPAFPISHLANKFLPQGKEPADVESKAYNKVPKQSLLQFSKALRNAIVGYHNRLSALQITRTELRLDQPVNHKGKGRENIIIDVSATDAEAKQIFIEWADGRIGRVAIDDFGLVEKCVILANGRRDRTTEARIIGNEVQRLGEMLNEI